jgi:predicted nucleic acid-binding protein
MSFLLDTGILLRLVDQRDVQHSQVRAAVRTLIQRHDDLFICTQNIAEFCNVATRPTENNGFGISPSVAVELLEREIEPIVGVLLETDQLPTHFKRLIATYQVSGKQVHDTRLVAMMLAWNVENILTLNERNFKRYEPEGIAVGTPAELAATQTG